MDSKDYIYQIFGCQGRKAIVTGASSGLGAAMARVLASAGADPDRHRPTSGASRSAGRRIGGLRR